MGEGREGPRAPNPNRGKGSVVDKRPNHSGKKRKERGEPSGQESSLVERTLSKNRQTDIVPSFSPRSEKEGKVGRNKTFWDLADCISSDGDSLLVKDSGKFGKSEIRSEKPMM